MFVRVSGRGERKGYDIESNLASIRERQHKIRVAARASAGVCRSKSCHRE